MTNRAVRRMMMTNQNQTPIPNQVITRLIRKHTNSFNIPDNIHDAYSQQYIHAVLHTWLQCLTIYNNLVVPVMKKQKKSPVTSDVDEGKTLFIRYSGVQTLLYI